LPAAASIDQAVRPALATIDPEGVHDRLGYLERRLHLIETLEPERDRVRFLLDPVAEYLAGLHLVEIYKADESEWREFLAQADVKSGNTEASRGFLLAVRDCCLARRGHVPVPDFLEDQLTERAAVPALTELLSDKGADIRIAAAEAFGQIGPLAEPAEPALIRALKDDDKFVRRKAARILGAIGSRVEETVPALIEALRDEDVFVRRRAAEALGRIGPAAVTAVPALIEALRDESEICREKAAVALGQIGRATEGVVPALIAALEDQNPDVRWQAAVALGNIGPAAGAAAAALRAGLKDPMAGESMAAALRAIEVAECSTNPSSQIT
jgi:HEAT repeat protein